ncbi:MAG: hypothetical protein M3464_06310 [Chloroflexota bacterium]|nr:hypothetical protein [Chloroflexota bacterium]
MASGAVTPGAIPTIERPGAPAAAVAAASRWQSATRGLAWSAFAVILPRAAATGPGRAAGALGRP